MHYLLIYETADDYVSRRAPHRAAHLQMIRDAHRCGEVVMAGAMADPIDGAMLIFRDASAAERFASADPYVLQGAVRSWKIRNWNTVIGDGAIMPNISGEPAGEAAAIEVPGEVPGRPEPGEYPPYGAAYVQLVEGGDVVRAITAQQADVLALLRPLSEEKAAATYAPGKWSIKEVLGHITDVERIFSYRALCLARGETTPLPGFEGDDYTRTGDFNSRPLGTLLEDFRAVRESTLSLYSNLPAEAWHRRGTVNTHSVTVRGLAFNSAGHDRHHIKILRERYLS